MKAIVLRLGLTACAAVFGVFGVTAAGLPSDYTRLEYIESTGTQYVDTGLLPTRSTELEIRYQLTELPGTTTSAVFGYAGATPRLHFGLKSDKVQIGYNNGADSYTFAGQPDLNAHTVTFSGRTYRIDGTAVASAFPSGWNGGAPLSLCLFAYNQSSGAVDYFSKLRLFSCAFTSLKNAGGSTVAAEFIPCKNAEGVVGLYETASGEFFANSATGDGFTAGPVMDIFVAAVPAELSEPSTGYGWIKGGHAVGETYTFEPPADGELEDLKWHCSGWTFETESGVKTSGTGTASIRFAERGTLTWNFAREYKVEFACDGGDVDTNKLWYAEGEVATVEFTPDATHAFYKWAGDVDAASQKTNPLTFTVDGPKSIQAKTSALTNVTTGEALLAAVAAASETEPTIIEVAEGDIFLTATLKLTKPITVRGAGMGKTFLRRDTSVAQVRGLYLSNADAVVEGMSLSGFYVKDSTDSTSTSAGLRMTAGTVRNCEFNGIASACNTGSDWNKGSPCATVSGASSKVIGCVFHGTAGGAMTGAALWLKDNAVADTCLFYGNSVNSTSIVQIDSGTVRNCTIVGNTIASSCAVYIAGTGSYLKDSIVYGNNGTSASSGSSVQGHGYDIKAASASTLTSQSLNNFTDDPGFVDFANGDYRLRPGSPCINAGAYGAETTALTSTDVSGAQTRQFGSATDIGAYECDPGTTPACFFTCNSSQALVGDELAINLYSHMGGESPVYTIDWGDGLPAEVVTGTAAFHAYSAPGNYTVALSMSGAEEYRVVNALTAMPKDLFVAYDGKGTAPYASPDSPAAYIEDALACTVDGCTIWLQDGDYKLKTSSTLALRKNVKIRSLSGDPGKVTLTTQTKDSAKLLILDSADAGVYGITLFGGYAGGQNSYYGSCIEITSHGGVVSNCVVHSGKANGWGGAAAGIKMAAGKVTHCVISNHSAHCAGNYKGSAVYASGGSVENCLISENKSSGANGYTVHLAGGKMYNCTVAGNSHTAYAGVLVSSKDSKIVNCAIAENTSTDKSGDFVGIYGYEGITASQASGCFDHCASPSKINDNCFDGNMGFVAAAKKDFHLVGNSACRDKGTAEGLDLAELDLDGNARVDENSGIVDIGCYEFHSTGLSAAISSDPAEKDGAVTVLSPHRVAFTAVVDGGEAKSCRWFVNGIEQEGETTTAFTTNFTASGTYSVTAKISDGQNEYDAGNAVAVKVYPPILYVDKKSTNPVAPYETEATAATFLEDALAAATDNCEIRIAPETYPAKSGAISVGKGVTIRGMGATPADVVLTRKNKSTNHRILTLNHESCWITGLTLDDGYLANQSERGAGVCIEGRGGTVSNCVIRNCQGATMDCYGGGACLLVANALVTHCVITNCRVSSSSPAGSAEHGGLGVYMSAGSLRDSLIAFCGSNGTSYDSGLKGQDGTIAIRGGTVVNCTVASNVNATCSGIRARGGKVINTIISANRVTTSVLGDTATVMAGKVAGDSVSTTFENCLADKDVDGKFAVEDPAQTFLRPGNGNFRLRTGSKAIDAGDASAVTSTVDLRGNPRILCGAVDIGCYEKKIGLTVLVK